MDKLVEDVARALCRADHCDPDRKLAVFRGNPSTAWELYTEDAHAAIRAVVEGLEREGAVAYISEAGVRLPVYSLTALKEALK